MIFGQKRESPVPLTVLQCSLSEGKHGKVEGP